MQEDTPSSPKDGERPRATFHMTRLHRIGNVLITPLIRAGLVRGSYLLTTRGRKTGQLRTTPVTLVERDGKQWLVAPYGAVPWVLNARAAGTVSLQRRGRPRRYSVREVSATEAGPVLKNYVRIARPTRPYFSATVDAPAEQFAAEAERHPVFALEALPD